MTLHDKLKTVLKTACAQGTTVAEVFIPFDAKTSAYRANTPAAVFRLEEMEDKGFGLYRLTLRIDLLGKPADVEAMCKAVCAAFAGQINDDYWSVSLASGTLKETWDTDLNVDWGTMTLKGVAIEQ